MLDFVVEETPSLRLILAHVAQGRHDEARALLRQHSKAEQVKLRNVIAVRTGIYL